MGGSDDEASAAEGADGGRPVIEGADDARADVGPVTQYEWLESQHVLPFTQLSADEFELLCFLLLKEEHPSDRIYYYGKTGDRGRDVMHHEGSESTLVQCKRYEANVGVDVVRSEVAKLCVHVHAGRLPETPTTIAFYVARELSPQAQDLIDSQAEWIKVHEDALKAHLGKAPSQEQLAFATSWWPKFDRVIGAELTKRIRQYPALLDEFFRVRKVVDAELAVRLEETLRRVNEEREARMRPLQSTQDPFKAVENLIRQHEAENPGLQIRTESTASGTVFHVRARPGGGPVQAGKLRFPDTEQGRRGREKFEHMLDTGEGVTLTAGECVWEGATQIRLDSAQRVLPATVEIVPEVPDVDILVDLRVGATALRGARVRVERLGRLEYAIRVDSASHNYQLRLIGGQEAGAKGVASFDFAGLSPTAAVHLADFLLAKSDNALEIVDASSGDLLLDFQGLALGADESDITYVRAFASALASIETGLGVAFSFPDEMTPEDVTTALAIAAGMEGRSTAATNIDMILEQLPKARAEFFVRGQREGVGGVSAEWPFDRLPLLGQELDVGPGVLSMVDARPTIELDALEAAVRALGPGEGIDLTVRPARVIYQFQRWREPT